MSAWGRCLSRLREDGAAFIIHTDTGRDGVQCGVDLAAPRHLDEISAVPASSRWSSPGIPGRTGQGLRSYDSLHC